MHPVFLIASEVGIVGSEDRVLAYSPRAKVQGSQLEFEAQSIHLDFVLTACHSPRPSRDVRPASTD
jgi:hypothetical protein